MTAQRIGRLIVDIEEAETAYKLADKIAELDGYETRRATQMRVDVIRKKRSEE